MQSVGELNADFNSLPKDAVMEIFSYARPEDTLLVCKHWHDVSCDTYARLKLSTLIKNNPETADELFKKFSKYKEEQNINRQAMNIQAVSGAGCTVDIATKTVTITTSTTKLVITLKLIGTINKDNFDTKYTFSNQHGVYYTKIVSSPSELYCHKKLLIKVMELTGYNGYTLLCQLINDLKKYNW